ncbi:unnamed protein product [Symbiodinium sp. CCMP2592]|nr:unnamed protein product [Symbiodinium sp. CCMP2592]
MRLCRACAILTAALVGLWGIGSCSFVIGRAPSPAIRRARILRQAEANASSGPSRRQLVKTFLDWLPLLPGAYFVWKFSKLPKQYIAAAGDPKASSGTGAEKWGLWTQDPGPRGVRLSGYERLQATGGQAPAGWQFDQADWWLEEHGLIMEKPTTLPPGKYEVTGDREVTTTLTIFPKDSEGHQRWELADGAKLFDVTHLPCRSARYTGSGCSPSGAAPADFPVRPGAAMPAVKGCQKQDHAVLFVLSSEPTKAP